jgi:DNA-binding XRE family transcriptional regulator
MIENVPFYLVVSYCFWSGVSFWESRGRRCRLPGEGVISPDELLRTLKRYLAESGDTEEAAASRIGVNHHTLRRWLSDKQSPKKGKLALAAAFLRHAGYL